MLNTDQILSLEKDKLFRQWWHVIGHRSDLDTPKAFVKLNFFDEEIVIWNDNGTFTAFNNLCPHRGAKIFQDTHGNGPCLCPYHGWSLRNGKGNLPGCVIEDPRLAMPKPLQLAWCGDLLFCAHAPQQTLPEQLGSMWDTVERVSYSMDKRHDTNAFTFQSNWRVAVENALEPYHVALVHRNSLGKLKLGGENELHGDNSIYFSPVGEKRAESTLKKMDRLFDLQYYYPGFCMIFIFPWTMISSTFGHTFSLQNFHPSQINSQTHFYSRLYGGKLTDVKHRNLANTLFDNAAQFNRDIFNEDHDICQRVPETFPLREQAIFHAQEEKVIAFRKSYQKHVLEQA